MSIVRLEKQHQHQLLVSREFELEHERELYYMRGCGKMLLERASAALVARKSIIWARDSLERLPIRLTLENVGVLALFLALVMPRALTYALTYPIFRLVFGTLYPAYASYKAVRTKNVKEYVKWMMYWIVFALFTCAETFTDVFFSFWFPFYYEIKIILVLWLLSPATKGSSILYRRFVHPALCRREPEIDEAIARATEQGYSAVLQLGSKGVNYATTILMQTAIKGGGGLVQQLRKSYSLSDLTGEKEEDIAINHQLQILQQQQYRDRLGSSTPDEVDLDGHSSSSDATLLHQQQRQIAATNPNGLVMSTIDEHFPAETRRRERTGRRGCSPRRTQSSSNRVEMMYFNEVDLELRQSKPRSREPANALPSLTNVKSSDDISSGYSSGEALHSQKSPSPNDEVPLLMRTASVGARNRAKVTRSSSTKKLPEDEDYMEIDEERSDEQPSPRNPLSFLTSQQTLQLLTLLSQNAGYLENLQENQPRHQNLSSDSEDDSSTLKADLPSCATSAGDDGKLEDNAKTELKEEKLAGSDCETPVNVDKTCSEKLGELENLVEPDSNDASTRSQKTTNLLEVKNNPNVSRSNSDCSSSERAGRYHKRPAPKAPTREMDGDDEREYEEEDEELEEKTVKATLVIKTGTVKSFTTSISEPGAEVKRRKKSSAKTAARDSFTKLLTIPKNIFHNAFHKEETVGQDANSRSSSAENVDRDELDVHDGKKVEEPTYVSLKCEDDDVVRQAEGTDV